MRSTLACSWCRRSKVKCVHDGTEPCRGCRRGLRESLCVLSEPASKKRISERGVRSRAISQKDKDVAPSAAGATRRCPVELIGGTGSNPILAGTPPANTLNPVDTTALPLLIAAGWIIHKIPGISLIHTPTFFQTLRDGHFDRLKVCAMLAACAKFIPELVAQHGSAAQAGEVYASFVRRQLSARMSQGPHIETIQCLLLIGMYEWGESSGFNAWMYVGMAIRMSQALRPCSDPETSSNLVIPEMAIIRQETWDRTIWTCYAMDRLFSCGKDRPTIFVSAEMHIPLPLSEPDYMFGKVKEQRKYMKPRTSILERSDESMSMEHHFSIVLQGVDIWATLSKWTADGGRKRDHGPDDCPWKSASAWNKINRDLETWYNHLDERVKYSPAKLAAQLYGGYVEAFGYINLLYYLCLIFLHREFIPLFPLRTTSPIGPIDPPYFHSDAPEGWWESSAEILHQAVDCVSDILVGLATVNNPLMSPIVGFCAFSAALTLSHVAAFPHINLGRSFNTSDRLDICTNYLADFTKLYKIGEDWVSTLSDTQRLFERALSNKSKYVDRITSLRDPAYEYGSIVSTQTTPSCLTSTPKDTSAQNNDRPGPSSFSQISDATHMPSTVSDFSISEFPAALDLDEQFWNINDSFPGQQYLNSLTMGSESSAFGDVRVWH